MKKLIKRLLLLLAVVCLLAAGVNLFVIVRTQDRIVEASDAKQADCILVLGSGLLSDGTPGRMLSRRLNTAIELYERGAAPRLLMSGDHSREDYDEVNAMKRYAVEHGVPPEDIFMDHAGLCTYDSMVRARQVFGCGSVLIVSQHYHLYRAIWNAEAQGMEAQGVAAEMYDYGWKYTASLYLREALACVKDLGVGILRLPASVMGEALPISGSGEITDDASTALWLTELGYAPGEA